MYGTALQIVERFEDYLEAENVIVPNDDRPKDNDTPLYGETWADLVDDVAAMLKRLQHRLSTNASIQTETYNGMVNAYEGDPRRWFSMCILLFHNGIIDPLFDIDYEDGRPIRLEVFGG